ncbi:TRAP transporter small permease subunit [Roseovarius sp.]|uniref:TRAP transporter small permease subunit n=1 Tax=Roseovarius sp. TaxID=1486281 RepID=UPI003A9826C6
MLKLANRLMRVAEWIGSAAAWLVVPLILTTVFDVVSRRFFVLGSTRLQELEWHFHAALMLLCFGYGYVRNIHVRVDIFHSRFSPRTAAWIEALGCILFLFPYTGLVIYTGFDFAHRSFMQGETSVASSGLSHRWIIKSTLFLGFSLVLIASAGVFLRALHVLLYSYRGARAKIWD